MSDPISAAIEAAVQRAFDARLPTIIDAVKAAGAYPVEEDRFLLIRDAAKRLGMTPSSVSRLERAGQLPPREKIAGRVGYRASTVAAILAKVGPSSFPAPVSAIKSGDRRGGRIAKGGAA